MTEEYIETTKKNTIDPDSTAYIAAHEPDFENAAKCASTAIANAWVA